jgi:O-antigen ligase
MRRQRSLLAGITVVGTICVLSQGFVPLGRFAGASDTLDPGHGDPWADLLQGFALIAVLGGIVRNAGRVWPMFWAGRSLWPLWCYCLASAAWSAAPGTTIRRSILLLAYVLFGHYLVASVGARGGIARLRAASWLMLTASLLLYVAIPSLGQDVGDYQGALRGVFSQKNVTAWAFQLALAYLGYRIYAERRIGPWFVLQAIVIVGAIVLTRSTTELLACAMLICFWIWSAWFRAARLKLLPLWAAACIVAIAGSTLLALGDDAYALIGKDPGLTGRDVIWTMARDAIATHEWLGWGFQGFWLPDERDVQLIWSIVQWPVPHAHNGILELRIEMGLIGTVLYAIVMIDLLILVGRGLVRDSAEAWWTASWLILVVFKAHAEPVYLQLDMSTALTSFSLVVLGVQQRAAQEAQAKTRATASRDGFGARFAS